MYRLHGSSLVTFHLAVALCLPASADAGELAMDVASKTSWQGRIVRKSVLELAHHHSHRRDTNGSDDSAIADSTHATSLDDMSDGAFGGEIALVFGGLIFNALLLNFIWDRNFSLNGRSVRVGDKTDADAKVGILSVLLAILCLPVGCCAFVWPIDAGSGVVGDAVAVNGGKLTKAEKKAAKMKAKIAALLQPGKTVKIPEKKAGLMGKLGAKKTATIGRIEGDTVVVIGKDGVETALTRAEVLKANKLQDIKDDGAPDNMDDMKIVKSETHFHAATVFGAPRPDWMDKVDDLAQKYSSALTGHEQDKPETDEAILALFADSATWIDPVGDDNATYVGKDKFKDLLKEMPKVTNSEHKEVFYCASPNVFLVKYEVSMEVEGAAKVATLLDILEVDEDMKIVKAQTHFNRDTVFGAPRPDWMDKVDEFAKKYSSALTGHEKDKPETDEPILALFTDDATWIHPVGDDKATYVGKDTFKNLLFEMPKVVKSENQEVFYSASPKIFLAKYEVTMEGASGPAILVDRIEVA